MSSPRWKLWFGCTAAAAGLWALAIAQPVLDLLRQSPEFFVAHRADRLDVFAFVALSVLGPPLAAGALIGLAAVVGRSYRCVRGVDGGPDRVLTSA